MWTVIAYQEVVPTSEADYAAVLAVPDQHMRVDDDVVYIAALNQIAGVYVGGEATLLHAYLSSPSLRRLALLDLMPIEIVHSPLDGRYMVMMPDSPLPLETNEGLEAFTYSDQAVPADHSQLLVMLSDGIIAPTSGEIFSVEFTATITAVVNTWCNSEITFRQTLPVGRYAIVGAQVQLTDGVFFRFVPIGESHRPGGLCGELKTFLPPKLQRKGGLGVWCEFDQITPPSIECVVNVGAAGTAVTGLLDLIKIG